MARPGKFHDAAKHALEKDGWTIMHDPYNLRFNGKDFPIDIGAEKILAAEKNGVKIAVEVKSFLRESTMNEYHTALGQYINYLAEPSKQEPDRILYLALPDTAFTELSTNTLFQLSMEIAPVRFILFDETEEIITSWKD